MQTITLPLYHRKTWSVVIDDGRPVAFDLSSVTIEAIAHGLARVNRFCGATERPYSVAEHSVILARWVGSDARVGLLHDAPEALGVADSNGALKKAIAPNTRAFEAALSAALWKQFSNVPWSELWTPLHAFDQLLGNWEAAFFGFPSADLPDPRLPLPGYPRCLPPECAEAEFLSLWYEHERKHVPTCD